MSAVPPVIGLTGGMGAGKSTALAALAELGAAVISSDAVVHRLYAEDGTLRGELAAHFGADLISADGQLDRGLLAQRAFASEQQRTWLEALIWPRVDAELKHWAHARIADQPPPRAVVLEVPLLFESGLDGTVDFTLAIIAPEELRRDRAAGRGQQATDERAARQLPQTEKARRSDFVVHNDGTRAALRAALAAILAEIERRA